MRILRLQPFSHATKSKLYSKLLIIKRRNYLPSAITRYDILTYLIDVNIMVTPFSCDILNIDIRIGLWFNFSWNHYCIISVSTLVKTQILSSQILYKRRLSKPAIILRNGLVIYPIKHVKHHVSQMVSMIKADVTESPHKLLQLFWTPKHKTILKPSWCGTAVIWWKCCFRLRFNK